jgi:hypothetical protein
MVYSAIQGVVTRLGYPYKDNKYLRLIEIDSDGALIRYMYILPAVTKGDLIYIGTLLGKSQKLPYKGITQHVHVDVKVMPAGKKRRQFVNPVEYFAEQ